MHLKSTLSLLASSAALLVAAPAFAESAAPCTGCSAQPAATAAAAKTGQLIRITAKSSEKDIAWAKQERASYPLNVCVTSDAKLGSMGKSPEFIYRVEGQPDRLVVFCCAGCDEDFLAEPAKHLAKIDAAKATANTRASE